MLEQLGFDLKACIVTSVFLSALYLCLTFSLFVFFFPERMLLWLRPEVDKVAVPVRSTFCLPRLFKSSVAMAMVDLTCLMVANPCAVVFVLNAELLRLVSTISEWLQIRFYTDNQKLMARDAFKWQAQRQHHPALNWSNRCAYRLPGLGFEYSARIPVVQARDGISRLLCTHCDWTCVEQALNPLNDLFGLLSICNFHRCSCSPPEVRKTQSLTIASQVWFVRTGSFLVPGDALPQGPIRYIL